MASLEGVAPGVEFPRAGSVEVIRHVAVAPSAVEAALAAAPRFEAPLPVLLRLGFPRPVRASGHGLDLGDRRRVTFVGDAHHGRTHIGDLVLEVVVAEPGRVAFEVVEDGTRVAQWLRWRRAAVTWTPDGSGTRVSWRLDYERQLAPAWYFGPVQHGAARLAAGYLIDAVATPHG
jgi:hypothetical protein